MSDQFASKKKDNTVSSSIKVTEEDLGIVNREPVCFKTCLEGMMDMYSHRENVAYYLNDHGGWFVRCASPMKAEPFGQNGYTLTIGNYASLGYKVQPKMSVVFDAYQHNSYLMYSVNNPEFNNETYEIDYKSIMTIEEYQSLEVVPNIHKLYQQHGIDDIPEIITRINWKLDLEVKVKFPQFIYKLPNSLITKTGDRLLEQIVKQISPRLSYKVQKDFHSRFNIPIPPKSGRTCQVVKK